MPIAFATGDSKLDEAAGFEDAFVLEKPFDFESVKATVERLLAHVAQL